MKLYRFGSHLYDESKDKDVVVLSETVPKQLTKEYDLHVLHLDTLEPIFPETATKAPNLVKLCMKHCSELPSDVKERITVNREQLLKEVKKIHVQAVEQYLNIVLDPSLSDEELKFRASKLLFKIVQSHILLKTESSSVSSELFYKTGLVKLYRQFDDDVELLYNKQQRTLEIKDFEAEGNYEVEQLATATTYFLALDTMKVYHALEHQTINISLSKCRDIIDKTYIEEASGEWRYTVKKALDEEIGFPETLQVTNDLSLTYKREFIPESSIWCTP